MEKTAAGVRKKFIEFFKKKGHQVLDPSPLVTDDPSVLFTTAGMQQFKKWFSGEERPDHSRVVTIQPCLRTSDIDEVGDESHLTFFEMLGNFSFGDYGKKEAIEWAKEFLEKELKIQSERISVSVFKGEGKIPRDDESLKILTDLGYKEVKLCGREENFWGPTGNEGPCGPTVEFYVDPSTSLGTGGIEVWNLVFNQYYKSTDGKFQPLKIKGVDTGMGLERILAVLVGEKDVFKTELFLPIIKKIEELSGKKYEDNKEEFRIIADYIKAAIFIIADDNNIIPSNEKHGSILRKLIRDAEDIITELNFKETLFINKMAQFIINKFSNTYPHIKLKEKYILKMLLNELSMKKLISENLIPKIHKRIEILKRYINNKLDLNKNADPKWLRTAFINRKKDSVSIAAGKFAYHLWNTYRYSKNEFWQVIPEDLRSKINKEEFEKGYKTGEQKFKEVSRAGTGVFKSGLAEITPETTKLHTATHLLLAALRQVLGEHVLQKGSNITKERLRFDFSHSEKLTPEQIEQIEDLVNQKIKENLPVKMEQMSPEEAKKSGAVGVFDEQYGDKVKVYSISDFSKEICGGPHIKNTSELGNFKITKEESSSAGVRRIKAVLK